MRVVKGLQKKSDVPITLATDIVHHRYQRVFEQFSIGKIDLDTMENQLEWDTHHGTHFKPYGQLFSATAANGNLFAVGSSLESPKGDVTTPIPGVYPSMINSVIPDNQMVFGLDNRIAEVMAYWDYQIANRARNEWDGRGYLVILTERSRVEGGGGVPWQLVQGKNRSVYSFLLSWAEPYCTEGDNVWAKNPFLYSLGLSR